MIIFFPKVIPIGRHSAGWPNYQNPQIKNPKITKKSIVSKIRSRCRSTLGIGAKQI